MNKTPEMVRMEAEMSASEELRGKLDAAMKRIAEAGEAKSDGEVFEKAAAELGFKVTAAELERLSAANEEISPDEMEQAAGAGPDWKDSDGHDIFCFVNWHCFTAARHTKAKEGNEKVSCWSDYNCIAINH